MSRPDDAVFRVRVETFALLRRLLPVGILAGALVGPTFVTDPSVAMWLSPALFCSSLFVLWTINGVPLYPAHTFGIEYRFEDEPFESERRRCIRCETAVENGTHRRYARQIVVLGVPIHTLAWGSNDFCPDCAVADSAAVSNPDRNRTGSDATTTVEPTIDVATDSDSGPEPETPGRTTHERRDRDGPGTEIVRRVDRHDDATALELERAFDEDRS